MTEKLYRVLKSGVVSQREGAGFVERKKGAEISLSPEAAEHLLLIGAVEESGKKAKGDSE